MAHLRMTLGLRYGMLWDEWETGNKSEEAIAALVQSNKEQQAIIEKQKAEIEEMKKILGRHDTQLKVIRQASFKEPAE